MSETLQTGTSPKPVGTLRQLRELPHDARWMVVGTGLFALGTGLTLPFLLVYLHDVRGISTLTVGLIFGWTALLSLAAAPVWGSLID